MIHWRVKWVFNWDLKFSIITLLGSSFGFSVQKEKLRYAKNVVRQRDYMCSKEGFPQDSDNLDDKKFKKLQTRIACKASIRFTVTNGEWKVTHFNPTHNHELAKPEERPFLRSNRKITNA